MRAWGRKLPLLQTVQILKVQNVKEETAGTTDRDSVSVLTRVVVEILHVSFTAQQPQGGPAAKLKMDHGEGMVASMAGFALAEFKKGWWTTRFVCKKKSM